MIPNGTTIAAHVEQLRWSLAIATEFVRGGQPRLNWQESWSVRAVDIRQMLQVIRHGY